MMSRIACIFVTIYTCFVATPNTHGGEKEIQRFRDEYLPACAQIQDAYALLSGTIQMDKEVGNGKKRDQVSFKNAKDRSLARIETNDGRVIVMCIRPEGHYTLNQKSDEKAYNVLAVDIEAEAMFARNIGQYLRAPYSFLGEPFDRLVSDPTFRILSAESVSGNDHHGIEVTYSFGEGQPITSSTRIPPHDATVLFDPSHKWVISRGTIRMPGQPPERAISFTVDYTEAIDSIPLVSLVTYIQNGSTTKSRFSSITSSVVDPANFSMTAFGLPDISAKPPRQTNWIPYILVTAALFAFVASLWFRRLARTRFVAQAN